MTNVVMPKICRHIDATDGNQHDLGDAVGLISILRLRHWFEQRPVAGGLVWLSPVLFRILAPAQQV